ncbi:hypothetical protein [Pseudomonas yamanorum]
MARGIGKPGASQAVGNATGQNRLAIIVHCGVFIHHIRVFGKIDFFSTIG